MVTKVLVRGVGKKQMSNSVSAFGGGAKRGSVLVLKCPAGGPGSLPLAEDLKIYAEGICKEVLEPVGTLVSDPANADVAVVRVRVEPTNCDPVETATNAHSSLPEHTVRHLTRIAESAPLVVDVALDFPLSFPELARVATTVTVNFGVSDEEWLSATEKRVPEANFLCPASVQ